MASKYREKLVYYLMVQIDQQCRWNGKTRPLNLSYYQEVVWEAVIRAAAQQEINRYNDLPSKPRIAKALGINRTTLDKRLKELQIDLTKIDMFPLGVIKTPPPQ